MLPDAAQALWKNLRKADRVAAQARVEALRKRLPDTPTEELHRLLVQSKCLQAGAYGALSAVVDLVPGVGKVAGVFLGPVADTAMATALQAELVLETFALYDVDLGEAGERFAVLAIAATNVGATHASSIVAKLLTRYTGALIGGFVLKRALPVTRIATVATKNIALTYAIGMRAQAVARFRDAELDEWPKLMRQVTNIDERTLVEWATSAARTAIDQVQDSARSWIGRVSGLLPGLPDLRKFVGAGKSSDGPDLIESDESVPAKPKARRTKAKTEPKTPARSRTAAAKPVSKAGKSTRTTKAAASAAKVPAPVAKARKAPAKAATPEPAPGRKRARRSD